MVPDWTPQSMFGSGIKSYKQLASILSSGKRYTPLLVNNELMKWDSRGRRRQTLRDKRDNNNVWKTFSPNLTLFKEIFCKRTEHFNDGVKITIKHAINSPVAFLAPERVATALTVLSVVRCWNLYVTLHCIEARNVYCRHVAIPVEEQLLVWGGCHATDVTASGLCHLWNEVTAIDVTTKEQ